MPTEVDSDKKKFSLLTGTNQVLSFSTYGDLVGIWEAEIVSIRLRITCHLLFQLLFRRCLLLLVLKRKWRYIVIKQGKTVVECRKLLCCLLSFILIFDHIYSTTSRPTNLFAVKYAVIVVVTEHVFSWPFLGLLVVVHELPFGSRLLLRLRFLVARQHCCRMTPTVILSSIFFLILCFFDKGVK